ncbi:MAG: TonB-dependent siderophore receptor [Pseudomonadota bacterium]
MTFLSKFNKAVLLGTSTALFAGGALAQDDDRAKADTVETVRVLDSIIVRAEAYVPEENITANKTNIPLIQTPQSVSVITRDQIDLLGFIDLQQATRYTAGIASENYGPDLRFDFLTSRGFVPKQYINGVVAPSSTTIAATGIDLYAFESVEILKGPSSSLYGNTPPGGIYNQTTRRVSDDLRGELRARVGTDNFYEAAGTVTNRLTDGVSGRITALYRDQESYRDFVDAQRLLLAPAVKFDLSTDTVLNLDAIYQTDEVNGEFNGFLPVEGILLPNPNGEIPTNVNIGDPGNFFERDQYAIGAELTHDFNDTLRFVTNIRYADYQERTPQNVYAGGGFANTTDPSLPSFFNTLNRFNFTYAEDVTALSADTRLDGTFDFGGVQHKVIVGLDYRDVDNIADFGFFFDPQPIDLFNPVFTPVPQPEDPYPTAFNDQVLEQTGLYAQDQIELGQVYVTIGLRQDWVEIENALSSTSADQDAFTYRIGVNYVTDSGFSPYASYSTSFEPLLGTDAATGNEFDPSEGEQWEVGIKYDGRTLSDTIDLFASASLFQITQSDVVSFGAGTTPVFGTQSGEVEVQGLELELVTRIDDRISFNAAYSYTDSEVTENENNPLEVGEPLPVTPEHKIALFGNYNIQTGAFAGVGYGLGVRYVSESAGSLPGPFNPIVFDGEDPVLFDAILSYDLPKWRFTLNASNLADERYGARCASATGCNFGAPRQVIGTIQYKF